jgi:hypothetical protein
MLRITMSVSAAAATRYFDQAPEKADYYAKNARTMRTEFFEMKIGPRGIWSTLGPHILTPSSECDVKRTRSSSGRKITHPATAAPAGSNQSVSCWQRQSTKPLV